MNLLELSQEQQRNVIQMQLQGNAFFEHLVNIGECRKSLDAEYLDFESFTDENQWLCSKCNKKVRRCVIFCFGFLL